ncbi:hypothetical protein GCM10007301_54770 [Azorhizobium oxalatiphilum]|uniref:Uncharacterized protein n=1 Tax=Azorhizobium oxalatiphilum TaxID=980631 RepID=A0A917FIW3_9HYPH|nr:hypothetical protein [Azorhizobium oxalatiphilum]GGF87876.1 hypothetical protein GCM10007301_54770 [Azorhizobium oxalatiphilum]
MKPDLIADITIYATRDGGKAIPIISDYRCLCMKSTEPPWEGWSARMLFGGEPIHPGQRRRSGFQFLCPDAVGVLREAGRFFVWWEGSNVGGATVCAKDGSPD